MPVSRLLLGIFIALSIGFSGGLFCGIQNERNSSGVEGDTDQQRELLERIGEYQRREEARVAAEAARITAERDRIERTTAALNSIRESDRRSGDLLQELTKEIDILEDYFRNSSLIIGSGGGN